MIQWNVSRCICCLHCAYLFFKTGFSLHTIAEKDEIHICVLCEICKQIYQILDNAMFMIILKKNLEMCLCKISWRMHKNILNSFGYSWRHYLGDSLAIRLFPEISKFNWAFTFKGMCIHIWSIHELEIIKKANYDI